MPRLWQVHVISGLSLNHGLKRVDLAHNGMGSSVGVALVDALSSYLEHGGKALEQLFLEGNQLDASSLEVRAEPQDLHPGYPRSAFAYFLTLPLNVTSCALSFLAIAICSQNTPVATYYRVSMLPGARPTASTQWQEPELLPA